jgi:hypothetical protein
MLHPLEAKVLAIANPIPEVDPVTRANRFAKEICM